MGILSSLWKALLGDEDSVMNSTTYTQCQDYEPEGPEGIMRRCKIWAPGPFCEKHKPFGDLMQNRAGGARNRQDYQLLFIEKQIVENLKVPFVDEEIHDLDETYYDWDPAIPHVIDYLYASALPFESQHVRKEVMQDIHFRFQLKGTRNDVDMFHAILNMVDHDYPFDPYRNHRDPLSKCKKCGGYYWKSCNITPDQIKKAAKQAEVYVKIRVWLPTSKCKGELENVTVEQRVEVGATA